MQPVNPKNKLRDHEIRSALRDALKAFHSDEPDTAIIDELSLCQGDARVDVAVVNGSLSGYEIKSDLDTLVRLPSQLAAYELCFDTMTIVVGQRHVKKCRETLPDCWGIWEAVPTDNGIKFGCWREPQANAKITPDKVIQLLWKSELREALENANISAPAKASRRELCTTLVATVSREQLFATVRRCIRARGDWRSAPTPFRGDGSSRSAAKSPHFRVHRHYLLSAVSHHLRD
jgi:hypothetical protein